ncbi:cupredoxin family copper-binding protein [Candidatus Woesearchaeota archaeon]|nr:cupredoxin family copper-binding protein [Candidatus Woesearchaeota archaeon]
MKWLGILAGIILIVMAIMAVLLISEQETQQAPQQPEQQASQRTIILQNFAFSPSQMFIKAGDTVTWTNSDSAPHTVTSNSGDELDSPSLSPGETYSHTFTTAGTYMYHCEFHPRMTASITVQ